MRPFCLLQPCFPAALPLGAARFSPTVMTKGWLVVVQASRPRTRKRRIRASTLSAGEFSLVNSRPHEPALHSLADKLVDEIRSHGSTLHAWSWIGRRRATWWGIQIS